MNVTRSPMKVGELEIRPLTLLQVEELENWVRASLLKAAKEALAGDPISMTLAIRECTQISFFSGQSSKVFSSLTGLTKLLEASSDLTGQEAYERLLDVAFMNEFNRTFMLLNRPTPEETAKNEETASESP